MIGKAQLVTVLSRHVGAHNGVNVSRLVEELLGLGVYDEAAERRVRTLATELREEGIAVCAHPSVGYFMAANDEELERYCISFLRSRAMRSLHLICRLKKIALPDLIGQLRLKT